MTKSRARNAIFAGVVSMVATLLGTTALTSAQAAAPQTTPAAVAPAAVTASEMTYAVEDFNYPGAARLLEERGITLKRGDGHIILTETTSLAECTDPANIAIESRLGKFCFKANASTGYLTMELPDTFSIWTQDHPVQATLTADGQETVVSAPANDLTGVGESSDTGLRSVLVELRITG